MAFTIKTTVVYLVEFTISRGCRVLRGVHDEQDYRVLRGVHDEQDCRVLRGVHDDHACRLKL